MTIKTFFLHRRIKIIGAILLAAALLLIFLPIGANFFLTHWLEKNGADSATIQRLRFNPFLGRLVMEGVDVVSGGKQLLHNSTMVVEFGLASLRHHDIHLEIAEYRELSIDIEQYPDGRWRFGTYTTAPTTGAPEKEPEKPQEDAVAWGFLADRVVLTACQLHLKTPVLDSQIVIEQAELVRFTTREGQPAASLTLHGLFNDSRVDIQLENLQLFPDLKINGTVKLSGGNLAVAAGFVKDVLPSFAGGVGVSGKIVLTENPGKGIAVEYDGTIDVGGVEIGNETFTTKAKSLKWQGRAQYTAEPKKALTIEIDGALSAGNFLLQLPGQAFVTEESLIDLSGRTTVTVGKNVTVENIGKLLIEGVGVQLPQLGLSEERVAWQGKVHYNSADEAKGLGVHTAGSLDLGTFQVDGREPAAIFAITGTTLFWQGDASYWQGNGVPFLNLDGTLLGTELQEDLAESKQRFGQGRVELRATSTISLGDKPVTTGLGALTGEKLVFTRNENPLLDLESLTLTGLEGRQDGAIAVQNLVATGLKANIGGSLPLAVQLQEILLTEATLQDFVGFSAAGLRVKGMVAKAIRTHRELVRWRQLSIQDLRGESGKQVNANTLLLEGLTALNTPTNDQGKENPTLSLRRATLSDIGWSATSGMKAGTLHCDDLMATIIRDKDGGLTFISELAAMQEPNIGTATVSSNSVAKADQSARVPFRLDNIVVGGKSSILFTDHTLAVPLATDLAISKLELGKLDSLKPKEKTPVQLAGTFLNRAPIEVNGEVSPFLLQPALDLTLSLKNYPLAGLSPYTVQSVGTALASGQLRLKSQVKLTGSVLGMDNNVQLQKVTTETITPELAAQLNNQLPIPLDAALSLLRDSEDNITLDIPLQGPVSDLSVGISDILITALGKAIIPAASGYLMYALGPYGALAYVGMKVGEKLLQVQLPPILFPAGGVALTTEHTKYLERIAMILKDRPETDMQFCPVVASWELMSEKERAAVAGDEVEIRDESREMLLELGQQRAKMVRSHLVEKYTIRQDRLLICDTRIVKEKQAEPAVIPQI
ncbi:MAG: DUF748 domain-containing protein [Pseudomonadota bacterium]